MTRSDQFGEYIAGYRRVVIAVLLVATLFVGAGMVHLEESTSLGTVESQSAVMQADEYIEANFSESGGNHTRALVVVRNESGNVLSKQSLIRSLEYQQRLRTNETVNASLADGERIVGIGNIVARAAIARDQQGPPVQTTDTAPSLEAQIQQLSSMGASEVSAIETRLLQPDASSSMSRLALRLLPSEYEVGTSTAPARMMVITQQTQVDTGGGATLSQPTIDAQLAIRDIAQEQTGSASYLVVGDGLMTAEESQSMSDSFTIIGPIALLFVLITLAVSYRDILDIFLGLFGVCLVLVWTFGFMGWAGIEFNQIMIAVPVLLIGLSIDFAIHVVMRYREERAQDVSVRDAMGRAVSKVGVALALVTTTTAIGFLTNLTSSLPAIRNFGIVSTVGIVSAFIVFGALIPALKIELDTLLERFGIDRRKRAFGSGSSLISRPLGLGVTAAKQAPVLTLVLVLLLTAGSGYAALQVDGSFSEERFLSDEPPEWMESLPASMEPGEYSLKSNLHYVNANFQTPEKQSSVLVRGSITDPKTLDRLHQSQDVAADSKVTYVGPGGEAAVRSPLTLMDRVADTNETFNATLTAADTDGDRIPDQDIAAVYDTLFAVAPEQAQQYIHRRDNGDYAALKLIVSVDGSASPSAVSEQMGSVAAAASWSDVTAVKTGGPVVDKAAMEQVTSTVTEGLVLAVGLVFVLLMAAFRLSGRSASLGAITIVPTLLSVTWILGTMYLLGIPFSFTTAVVGSIAVGLGVDYAIHISERYSHELSVQSSQWQALETTISGTGGALLSSAITTASGFGVLTLTLLPGLRQFGLIIALSLLYAFISSVFIMPSILVLWTKYVRGMPDSTPTTADKGVSADD